MFIRRPIRCVRLPVHRPVPPPELERGDISMIRIRHLTLALLAIAPAAAFAQDAPDPYATQTTADGAKRFAVVGGYSLSEPTRNPQLGDSRAQLDGDGAATLSASYYVTDNIAVEAWGAVDKFGHRVNVDGQKAGS